MATTDALRTVWWRADHSSGRRVTDAAAALLASREKLVLGVTARVRAAGGAGGRRGISARAVGGHRRGAGVAAATCAWHLLCAAWASMGLHGSTGLCAG
eukprot:186650-Chlamydomonas_euryale.AAC.6